MNLVLIIRIVTYNLIAFLIGFNVACLNKSQISNKYSKQQPLNYEVEQNQEYDIYSLLIQELFNKDEKNILLIDNQTTISKIDESLDDLLKSIKEELKTKPVDDRVFQDFREKNKVLRKILSPIKCSKKCISVTHQELVKIFSKGDGWSILKQNYYPFESLITFSQVGFDDKKTQALVYMGYQNDVKAGAGFYFFLVKEEQTWKIKERINVWQS